MSCLFRGKLLGLLDRAFIEGRLSFHGALQPLAHRPAFTRLLARARETEWVVYANPPFGGPEQVLKYLARYTYRVAISNHRLLSLDDGVVRFRYKDYARGHRSRTLQLDAREFTRRFLLHVLPRGFVRIRRYGLLANARRERNLHRCRELLGVDRAPEEEKGETVSEDVADADRSGASPCPACNEGRMRRVETLTRLRRSRSRSPPSSARPP